MHTTLKVTSLPELHHPKVTGLPEVHHPGEQEVLWADEILLHPPALVTDVDRHLPPAPIRKYSEYDTKKDNIV
jgi:hypothetical protein